MAAATPRHATPGGSKQQASERGAGGRSQARQVTLAPKTGGVAPAAVLARVNSAPLRYAVAGKFL